MPKNKTPANAPVPVCKGDVFHTFIAEATSLGNEVEARRRFDADVCEFLEMKGLRVDFDAWRAAKKG